MSKDVASLDDILAAIAAIEDATHGDRNAFMQSAVIQDASLYRLVVIGEAVTRLASDLKDRHPGVDWRGISRFRNIAVHDYGHVDLRIVWDIITNDLAQLKSDILIMRQEEIERAENGS